jgi:signal transduction histidine kinase
MKVNDDDPVRHNIEQIMEATERATALTQDLLAFGRKQAISLQESDVNTIIRGFISVSNDVGKGSTFETYFPMTRSVEAPVQDKDKSKVAGENK